MNGPARTFFLAMGASLVFHLPIWAILGVVEKSVLPQMAQATDEEPVFFELEPLDDADTTQDAEPEEHHPPEEEQSPNEVDEETEDADPVDAPPVEIRIPEPEPEPELLEVPPPPPPPPMQPAENLHAVRQHSQNPDEEPPPDAQYLARENSTVEEETVAEVLSNTQDAEGELSPGAQLNEIESEELGNDSEDDIADTQDSPGRDDRTPTIEDAEREAQAERESVALPQPNRERRREQAAVEASNGGQEPEMETITVNDGFGTFTITRPRVPAGSGGGTDGGDVREARRGQRGQTRANGRSRRDGPNLQINWTQFSEIYSDEQLAEERAQYAEQVLSRQRGDTGRQERWQRFRSAIENYLPSVRVGNQTALNARRSPFAEFLTDVHRRLHDPFHAALGSLPTGRSHPLGDPSLITRLEIVFRGDGSIARIGVVRTSGVLLFDFTAFNAVMRGRPYPAPPDEIKSPDGRVYLHWLFHRSQPYCLIDYARPFILPDAEVAAEEEEGAAEAVSLELDAVVPLNSRSTLGLPQREEPE